MSAFLYLIHRTIVNTFKQSLKKPAQTILYAVLIIFVGFSMVMAGKEGNVPGQDEVEDDPLSKSLMEYAKELDGRAE